MVSKYSETKRRRVGWKRAAIALCALAGGACAAPQRPSTSPPGREREGEAVAGAETAAKTAPKPPPLAEGRLAESPADMPTLKLRVVRGEKDPFEKLPTEGLEAVETRELSELSELEELEAVGEVEVLSTQRGQATWYGSRFHGRRTASGEPFDARALTAAHRRLPFGAAVRVTNLRNQNRVIVRINDRGPFGNPKRIIDVSRRAAELLGMVSSGVAPVTIEILAPE